jgi:hypothetical protein
MIGINISGDIDLEFQSITGLKPVAADSQNSLIFLDDTSLNQYQQNPFDMPSEIQ